MKKGIVITAIGILLVLTLLLIINNSDKPTTFTKDGVLIALTVDGINQTLFPSRGNYKVEIDCKNGKGKWLVDEWKFAVEEITGNVTCNISFTTKTESDNLINHITGLKGSTSGTGSIVDEGNAGIRYEGQKPNNYIWFNNEKWRIIGVIRTKNDSGTTENLVKVIRNESLGGYAYDAKSSGHTGVWGSNTMFTLLNSYYWGKLDGTNTAYCYGYSNTSKSKCDYRVKGIKSTDYYGSMVREVYWNTGASGEYVTTSAAYANEITTQTVRGYVGLMNASDYGYATSESHTTNIASYNNAMHTLGNWLYAKTYEWTITQKSGNTSYALYVHISGNITSVNAANGYGVRPVLYLDSKLYIVSGDGSEANPYIVAKES